LARFGYAARGVVYCLVGGLALQAALGSGGQTGGSRSALATLPSQPFGRIILGFIALGLIGFAGWRIVEGLTDADNRGKSPKALAVRAAHVISGFIYGGLALAAVGMALGRSSGGSEDQAAQGWTGWRMSQPLGQWLVGLVGVAVAGTGIAFAVRAWRAQVTDKLALDPSARNWAIPLGRLGFAARGLVFVLIGGFLLVAALHSNSSEVKGLGGALESLQSQPYGWALLAVTAGGLFAFGVFGLVQARYRRIDAPDPSRMKAAAGQTATAVRKLDPLRKSRG
jgi:hypothetical protein